MLRSETAYRLRGAAGGSAGLLYCEIAPTQAIRPNSRVTPMAASRWSPPTPSRAASIPSGAAAASSSDTGPSWWSKAASKPSSPVRYATLAAEPALPITRPAPSTRAICPATLPTAPAAAEM